MKNTLLILSFVLISPLNTLGQILQVPADYSTIQNAIDAADANDTIIVSSGTYFENLYISKPLTLSSEYLITNDTLNITNTIIDGDTSGSVIIVKNIPSGNVNLIGLSITNGNGTYTDSSIFGQSFLFGGGLLIDSVNAIKMDHLFIHDNIITSLHNSAGGIYSRHSGIELLNSKVQNNQVSGGSFLGEGAGVFLLESDAVIDNCLISGNVSSVAYGEGGGIYLRDSELLLTNSTIRNNESIDGGGMLSRNSNVIIESCNIENNLAHLIGGLGIMNTIGSSYNFSLNNSKLNNNVASNTFGTLHLYYASITITNSEINDNKGGYAGGAIYSNNSDFYIYDSEINRNESSSGIGGDGAAMHLYRCNVYLNNVMVDSNFCGPFSSQNYGGAMHISHGTFHADSSIFSNNLATHGGAFYLNNADVKLNHCLINGNSSDFGGAIRSYGSQINILSSTVAKNSAMQGGAFLLQHDTLLFVNSILNNNPVIEIQFLIDQDGKTLVDLAYSNIPTNGSTFQDVNNAEITWHDGNVFTDPLFIDATNDNFHLNDSSTLIDAGTHFFVLNDDTIVNIPSDNYNGAAPDIGAFETPVNSLSAQMEQAMKSFRMGPNPFSSSLSVALEGHACTSYELFDMKGRVIRTKRLQEPVERFEINTTDLKPGTYYLRVTGKKGAMTRQVIKVQ